MSCLQRCWWLLVTNDGLEATSPASSPAGFLHGTAREDARASKTRHGSPYDEGGGRGRDSADDRSEGKDEERYKEGSLHGKDSIELAEYENGRDERKNAVWQGQSLRL